MKTQRILVPLALFFAACGERGASEANSSAASPARSNGGPAHEESAGQPHQQKTAPRAAASGENAKTLRTAADGGAAGEAASAPASQTSGAIPAVERARPGRVKTPVIRGIYVNRFAAQSNRRMASLIALADSTEINAFVIDLKDEFGLNYKSTDSTVARNAGRSGSIPNIVALLDTLRAHGIVSIARIVVFKDSVAARLNPEWTIRKADGGTWLDREGLAWVNPYQRALWDYNIRVAEEAAALGFDEIQWDYIRFPEPYKSLPPQVFPGSEGLAKPDALAAFLADARRRLSKLGVASTADVFGLTTTVKGTLEIGQRWETLAAHTDVLLPMVYPSHYPAGAFGVARPNGDPYKVVHGAVRRAHERNLASGISGESVRPWLQAFTLGQPAYGPEHLNEQKRAVYDAGFDGWVLWHPGSKYEIFASALEPQLESRKKPFAIVAQQVPNPR